MTAEFNPSRAQEQFQLPLQLQRKFQEALSLHQKGFTAQSQVIYQEILKSHPLHFDSLHLLGVTFSQGGRFEEAVQYISKAISINPSHASSYNNLGNAFKNLNRLDQALASYDKALTIKPDYAEVYNNRGNALKDLRRLEEALISYDQAIAIKPDYAVAYNNRGNALKELMRLDEALVSYNKALAIKPDHAEAYNNRGNTLMELRRQEEALESYNRALSIKPDYADALNNRGVVLRDLRRSEEALASYDQAIAIKPNYAEAYNNRGNLLQDLNQLDGALENYNKALAMRPDYAEAYNNRGNSLRGLNRLEEALLNYDKAIKLRPDYAEAHSNRAVVLEELKRLDEALASYSNAISLRPDFAPAYSGRGWILSGREEWESAKRDFETALKFNPSQLSGIAGLAKLPSGLVSSDRLAELLVALERSDVTEDVASVLFAKADLLSQLGRHDESFALTKKANAQRLRQFSADDDTWKVVFDELETELNSWRPATSVPGLPSRRKLLVILGASRSGKTSLERMLCLDSSFFRGFESCRAGYAEKTLRQITSEFHPISRAMDIDLRLQVLQALFPSDKSALENEKYNVLTITNPLLISSAHTIYDLYDESYFIFLKRDPLDNAAEIFRTDYSEKYSFAYHAKSALDYVKRYNDAADFLADKMTYRALQLNYETFLKSPSSAIHDVYSLLGMRGSLGYVGLADEEPIREAQSPYRSNFSELLSDCTRALIP